MKFSVTAAAVSALAIESASASQFDWSSPSIRALNSRGGCVCHPPMLTFCS